MHPRLAQIVVSRAVERLTEGLGWRPGRVADLYFRVDDPRCVLLVQALPEVIRQTGLRVRPFVVPHPAEDVMPQPAKAAALARRDALEVVRHRALTFDAGWQAPTGARLAQATAAALAVDTVDQLRDLTLAAWRGDPLDEWPCVTDAAPRLQANARRLRRRGHYLSGMIHYRGAWYAGIDRLDYLTRRLGCAPVIAPRTPDWPATGPSGSLHVFFSFRSPYSYLAIQRLRALVADRPISLRLRPVLPMVMRGLPVPRAKRLYLVRDCAREARRQGIAFGRIADPLGAGVERCIAVFRLAEAEGIGLRWLEIASRAIWAEGVDVATDAGLRRVVEAAGLSWAAAQDALGSDGWRADAEANRAALLDAGLWGVPGFVWGDLRLWGQDRMATLAAWLDRYAR